MAVTWRKLAYEDDVLLVTGATTGATSQAQTFTSGVIDSSLAASRLLASNGSKKLASVANLADWIAGTANQVTVTNDGDGSVTLSLPQDIHTAATPTFGGVITAYIAPAVDGTTAVQIRKQDKTTAVLTIDTTNTRIRSSPIGIGVDASLADIRTSKISAATSSLDTSIWTLLSVAPASPPAAGTSYRGLLFQVSTSSAIDMSNAIMYGMLGQVTLGGTGAVSQGVGIMATVFHTAASTSGALTGLGAGTLITGGGTVASAVAVRATNTITSGTVTNSYGVYVDAISGASANYAIYTNGGLVRLGDQLKVDGSADRIQLIAQAHSTQTTNILEIQDSSANVLISANGSGGLIVNEQGNAAGDLRAESDTEANMLWLDASADLLYLGGSTNGVQIAKGGDLTLLGTAKYERHVQIAAALNGPPATQPSAVGVGTAGGLQFSSSVSQYAYCQWEIPDDWDGTDCYIEIDWLPDSGAISGTSAVRWTVEYRSIAEGETITNGTAVTVDNGAGGDTADYSQYQTKHTRFTLAFNNANQPLTAQDHMYFKLGRDTGVTNDFTGTVVVTAFEIIYNSKGFPTSN